MVVVVDHAVLRRAWFGWGICCVRYYRAVSEDDDDECHASTASLLNRDDKRAA